MNSIAEFTNRWLAAARHVSSLRTNQNQCSGTT